MATAAVIAVLFAIELLVAEPAATVLSILTFVAMAIVGRLLVNRPPKVGGHDS